MRLEENIPLASHRDSPAAKQICSLASFPKASWAEADSNKPEWLLGSSAPVHEREDHQRSVTPPKLQATNQQFSLGRSCFEELSSPVLYAHGVGPARTNRSWVRNHNRWDSKGPYCCPVPMSTQHRTASLCHLFIQERQSGSLWCGFSSTFVHVYPPDSLSNNAFFCCKCYLWRSHCGGMRWQVRDGCPFVIYPAWPKHCSLFNYAIRYCLSVDAQFV